MAGDADLIEPVSRCAARTAFAVFRFDFRWLQESVGFDAERKCESRGRTPSFVVVFFPDASVVKPDGIVVKPDGTVAMPDGIVVKRHQNAGMRAGIAAMDGRVAVFPAPIVVMRIARRPALMLDS